MTSDRAAAPAAGGGGVGAGRSSKRSTGRARSRPRVETSGGDAGTARRDQHGHDENGSAPPAWAGDVALGVQAWVGADRPTPPPADAATEDPEPDHEAVGRKILLDALTGQARSRKELADKLAKRGVPDDLATRLLDRFTEVGLVDDTAFARQWVESRQRSRGLAPRALAQELRRKGIDDETARDALAEVDDDDQDRAARELVRKKLPSMRRLDPPVATRRLVGMLARKGYAPGLAFRVVKEELGASEDDDFLDD